MNVEDIKETLNAIKILKNRLKMNPTFTELSNELEISQPAAYYRCQRLREMDFLTFSSIHRSLRSSSLQKYEALEYINKEEKDE